MQQEVLMPLSIDALNVNQIKALSSALARRSQSVSSKVC
jgi:hypothetical protein